MPDGSFLADAVVESRRFTGDAWILAPRNQHDRANDHTGTQDDTTVVLSAPIGPYPAGTTIAAVLAGLFARLVELETGTRRFGNFTGDAFIGYYFTGSAITRRTISSSFTGDAWFDHSGSFTGDAYVRRVATGSFTGDAFIV